VSWKLRQVLIVAAVVAVLTTGWYFGYLPLPA
jgi:hypothetical protein